MSQTPPPQKQSNLQYMASLLFHSSVEWGLDLVVERGRTNIENANEAVERGRTYIENANEVVERGRTNIENRTNHDYESLLTIARS